MKKILLLLFFPVSIFAQAPCEIESNAEYGAYGTHDRYAQLISEISDDENVMEFFDVLWGASLKNQFSAHISCLVPELLSKKYNTRTGIQCENGEDCVRFIDDPAWRNFMEERAQIPNQQFDVLPLLGFWQLHNTVKLEITPEKVKDDQWKDLLSTLENIAPLSALSVMSGIDMGKVYSTEWKSSFLNLANDQNAALLAEYMTIDNATDEMWTSLIRFMIDNHMIRLDRELLNQLTSEKIHDLNWNREARYFIEKYPDDFGQFFVEGLTLDIVHDPLKLAFLHQITDSKKRFSGLEMKGFSEQFSGKKEINPEVKSLLMHVLEVCPEIDIWQTQGELTAEKASDRLWRGVFDDLILSGCVAGAGKGVDIAYATKNLSLEKAHDSQWVISLKELTKNDRYPRTLIEHISVDEVKSNSYIDFLRWYKWYLFQNKDDDTPFNGSLGIQWGNWYKVTPQQTNDSQWVSVTKYLIRNNIKQDIGNQYASLGLENVSIEMSHDPEFLEKIQYKKPSFGKRLREEISFRIGFWQMMQQEDSPEVDKNGIVHQQAAIEKEAECGQFSPSQWGYISLEEANIMQNDIGAITEFLYSQYLEKFKQQDNDVCMEGISDFRGVKFKEAKTTDFRNMYKTTVEYEFFPMEGSHFSNFYEDIIPDTWNYRVDATFAVFEDVDGWYGMPGVQWHWGGGGGPRRSMTNVYDNGVLFSFLKVRSIKIPR